VPSLAREEILIPFPDSLAAEPSTTHCRGTLLTASFGAIRSHGHHERYLLALPPEYVTRITTAIATEWIPMDVVLAHYRACEALGLSVEETLTIGGAVVMNLQRTFIGGALKKAAAEAGVGPLFGLQRFASVYYRTMKGGGGRIVRLGPKDVRMEFVGQPLSSVRYFRVSYRGFIQAGCAFFARRAVVAELADYLSPTTCAYRVAWA
jgi:hypothetical protein